jgi:polyphosphate glucokinase
MAERGFGVDIGGSGVKAGIVDLSDGQLVGERIKLATPKPATPAAIAARVADLIERFAWTGPVGCTFPAVITAGVARTASNVDPSWIGTNVETVIGEAAGVEVTAVNDADAAAMAEAVYGDPAARTGRVIFTTLGTGIGTAILQDGSLIANTELGHLEVDGRDAETRASAAARDRDDLSWKQWAARLDRYYGVLENLLWPDLFVVGGGVSRRADRFLPLLHLRTPIVPATLTNSAGIVGAALAALAATATRPPRAPGS